MAKLSGKVARATGAGGRGRSQAVRLASCGTGE